MLYLYNVDINRHFEYVSYLDFNSAIKCAFISDVKLIEVSNVVILC